MIVVAMVIAPPFVRGKVAETMLKCQLKHITMVTAGQNGIISNKELDHGTMF